MAAVWPLLLAIQRRWTTFFWALGGAAALTAISVALAGPAAFAAFLRAAPELGQDMAAGRYRLHRMTSIYACALSLGVPAGGAIALHAAVAVAVLAGAAKAAWACDARVQLGLSIFVAAFVSPYFYDYDLAMLGVGAALVLPALETRLSARRQVIVFGLMAAAQIVGVLVTAAPMRPSLGGPLLLIAYGGMLQALTRRPAETSVAHPLDERLGVGA